MPPERFDVIVTIDWTISEEEPFDIDSVLGDLWLVAGRVSVGCATTYVDTWLAAFVTLRESLATSAAARIEIVEEPIELVASREGDELQIGFNDVIASHIPVPQFDRALQAACRGFVEYVARHDDRRRTDELAKIEEYVRTGGVRE